MSSYTERAVTAVLAASRNEQDFGGWLAQVLATVAGQLGGSDELTIGRPGSWEASHVVELVKGTVGYDDESLPGPMRKLTDAKARAIKEACDWSEMTHQEIAADYGISPSTVSDIANERTWGWL
jgi:hypothetical protein